MYLILCFKNMGAESWYTMLSEVECSNPGIRFWFEFPLCSPAAMRIWVSYFLQLLLPFRQNKEDTITCLKELPGELGYCQ